MLLVAFEAVASANCEVPIEYLPIPELRVHRDFPVDYRAQPNRTAWCGSVEYAVEVGPPGFRIDSSGALFYWTPETLGRVTITLRVTEYSRDYPDSTDTVTFDAVVDDNTITYPIFRDYRNEEANIGILGRALGDSEHDFLGYELKYALIDKETDPPGTFRPITAGTVTQSVETTGLLANWDISGL